MLNTSSFSDLGEKFYTKVQPLPVEAPYFASINHGLLSQLGYKASDLKLEQLSGLISSETIPAIASVYAGHQFGQYAGRLGDGRAMLLGDVVDKHNQRWELQLKGAGQTPYSRGADGRAVLCSTIREYLCSEAMYGLHIPTSRALCVVASEQEVYREKIETAAVLTRLAPSHIRFGHFEWFYYNQEYADLKKLADFIIKQFYPTARDNANPYLSLLEQVVKRTAKLIAQWQLVGFSHGVMNTDNMSILGLTIDYGPFGFTDAYNPAYVCNHSDHQCRYAYKQQPYIGLWNLRALAQTFLPLVNFSHPEKAVALVQEKLDQYQDIHDQCFMAGMRLKLGLPVGHSSSLVVDLLNLLTQSAVDYTIFFRELSYLKFADKTTDVALGKLFKKPLQFFNWTEKYREILSEQEVCLNDGLRQAQMRQVNPKYILRNHLAQTAIEQAESGDFSEVDLLLNLLKKPYSEQKEFEDYAKTPPA